MKRTMLAILAISPLMMHGQVKSSAQPGSTPTLESSNVQPAALAGIKSADHSASPTAVRVSSGVTAPVLVHSVDVDREHILGTDVSGDRVVRVAMTVDASGKPTDLKVIQSTDKFTDQAILTAASQYRYKPATLNGSAVPMELTVNFTIE
ncbi:MAG TPA: TonB family protein [Acidobacteriaceae bacterium]|nr:TonB family protein [Acidobacteriaceae bacterium]